MSDEKTDQEQFDEHVKAASRIVVPALAGAGIVAALSMSIAALIVSSDRPATTTVAAAPAAAPAKRITPMSANVVIDHVTRGCHALTVNGGPLSPDATIRLMAGGRLNVQDNDVMPHQLMRVAGPQPQFFNAAMSHMGATSTVTFRKPGTYSLTTKAGEDYMKGIQTIGPDNTLHIKVLVSAA